MIRASALALIAMSPPPRGRVASRAATPDAVATLYRSSYCGAVRSGGISSAGAVATDL
jgi:hypothetical protein